MTYREVIKRLGEATEAAVLSVYADFVAGALSEDEAVSVIAWTVAKANARAVAVADLSLAATIMLQLRTPVATLGLLPPPDDQDRLQKAAVTLLAVLAVTPDPEGQGRPAGPVRADGDGSTGLLRRHQGIPARHRLDARRVRLGVRAVHLVRGRWIRVPRHRRDGHPRGLQLRPCTLRYGRKIMTEPEGTQPAEDITETTEVVTEEVAEPDTFPREYVTKLRDENARYRQRAGHADELARRLHTELVRATGRLADAEDLPFAEAHLDDPDALTAALDELLVRKAHLASRRPTGDVGQGATQDAAGVSLAGLLRAGAA